MQNQTRHNEVRRRVIDCGWNGGKVRAVLLVAALMMGAGANVASAQSLNWEGQTGIFVTPMAYSAPSTDKGFGRPIVAYHYLGAGPVLGSFNQASVTIGAFDRLEFGYSRDFHDGGNTAGVSNLWSNGFNTVHGKLNLVLENPAKANSLPAISVGFIVRSQVRNVGGVIQNQDTTNADFYAVATKTITRVHEVPLVFNAGFKATNASVLGLAGNTTAYKGRAFGAVAFVLRGPRRSTLLFGSELLQEPRTIQNLPGAVVPTTITYACRIVPAGAFPSRRGWMDESPRLSIDLGIAQAVGNVMPGLNLNARHQLALGISYGF